MGLREGMAARLGMVRHHQVDILRPRVLGLVSMDMLRRLDITPRLVMEEVSQSNLAGVLESNRWVGGTHNPPLDMLPFNLHQVHLHLDTHPMARRHLPPLRAPGWETGSISPA